MTPEAVKRGLPFSDSWREVFPAKSASGCDYGVWEFGWDFPVGSGEVKEEAG
jgi:hypothetical protein